jgi:hypothetical protein
LTTEIEASQRRLARRTYERKEHVAAVVLASPEFEALIANIEAAWQRLRSLRVVFNDSVMSAIGGHVPQSTILDAMASRPLEERVGHPVNEMPTAWAAALEALLTDPQASLPSV